jgi:predicted MFS family arabinose efflux permease
MFASLAAFAVLTMLTATAQTVEQLILFRIITGIGASGVVPLALALVGRLYPYEQRARALGWLFGAMAGGMAFGSPLGAMLAPLIGWRGLFLTVGAAAIVLLLILYPTRRFIAAGMQPMPGSLRDFATGYRQLLGSFRGGRTYVYVLLNSIFHSGVFTWLGLYLARKHGFTKSGLRCLATAFQASSSVLSSAAWPIAGAAPASFRSVSCSVAALPRRWH